MDGSTASGAAAARGRSSRRSTTAGRVAFVYGVAGTDELPGPAVVRLLGDCGMSEAAARSLLARLRADGDIVATRTGRATTYTLAGAMRAAWQRGGSGALGTAWGGDAPASAWDGRLHGILYTVPERHRSFRDGLRRLVRLAGYAPFGSGLFVGVVDRWDVVAAALPPAPAGARVAPVSLRMRRDDAVEAMREAWQLDELAGVYVDLAERLEAATDEPLAPDAACLRRFEALTFPVYSAFAHDPGLPPELWPPGWPVARLREALGRVLARYQGPMTAYVDEVLADVRSGASGVRHGSSSRVVDASRVDEAHERDPT